MAERTKVRGVEECKCFSPPYVSTASASSTRLPLGPLDLNTRVPNTLTATPRKLRRTGSQRSARLARKRASHAKRTEGQRLHDAHEKCTLGGSFLQHLGAAGPATGEHGSLPVNGLCCKILLIERSSSENKLFGLYLSHIVHVLRRRWRRGITASSPAAAGKHGSNGGGHVASYTPRNDTTGR